VNLFDDLWIQQNSNTTKSFNHIIFTDSLNGWAAGDSGIIVHTTNGGILWQIQNTNTINFIYDIRFLNNYIGWAIACNNFAYPNAIFLKTTTAGLNWQKFPFNDTTLLLFTICFQNESFGWVAGYGGKILNTTNGGSSWDITPGDTSQFKFNSINRIKFYNNRFALACGGFPDLSGVTWKFTNPGSNWFGQGIAGEPLYDIAFLDSLTAFLVGGDIDYGLIVLQTTNAGLNWNFNPVYYFGTGKGISFRTNNEAWVALSYGASFAVTTNTGQNWFNIPAPNNTILNDVVFTDYRNGWTAGNNGAIYKFNSALIGIEHNSKNIDNFFTIYPNYPNPFNPSTNISFEISKNANVQITIFDITGKKITTLVNHLLLPGKYNFQFDGNGLSSGVYLCKINIQNNIIVQKLVLTK